MEVKHEKDIRYRGDRLRMQGYQNFATGLVVVMAILIIVMVYGAYHYADVARERLHVPEVEEETVAKPWSVHE